MDWIIAVSWIPIALCLAALYLRRPHYNKRTGQLYVYHNDWLYFVLGMAVMAFLIAIFSRHVRLQ